MNPQDLTDPKLRRMVADALGVSKFVGLKKRGLWYRPNAKGYTSCECNAGRFTREEAKKHEYLHGYADEHVRIEEFSIPDYPNDLNACHEMENHLKPGQFHTFLFNLEKLTSSEHCFEIENRFAQTHATARQHCIAFLRTVGRIL